MDTTGILNPLSVAVIKSLEFAATIQPDLLPNPTDQRPLSAALAKLTAMQEEVRGGQDKVTVLEILTTKGESDIYLWDPKQLLSRTILSYLHQWVRIVPFVPFVPTDENLPWLMRNLFCASEEVAQEVNSHLLRVYGQGRRIAGYCFELRGRICFFLYAF